MRSAPGLSVQALLESLDVRALGQWLGPGMLDLVRAVDPGLAERDALRQIAVRVTDPAAVLRDRERMTLLVSMLPIEKARELAGRLGSSTGTQLYVDLARAAAETSNQVALGSFFGIVEDPRAPRDAVPSQQVVRATYGLFPHQRLAASRVQAALAETPRRVILHMPTGSGKTRTAMHVACEHLAQRQNAVVVWLAASRELLDQASDEFAKAWPCLGNREVSLMRFWSDHDAPVDEIRDGIVIAGLGKLHSLSQREPNRMLALADVAGLTIFDEAHQAIAPTYRALVTALQTKQPKNALLGLTATPGRTWSDISQDAELSDFFGNAKVTLEIPGYDNPVSFLIAEGYLAHAEFRSLDAGVPFLSSEDTRDEGGADYSDALLDRVGSNVSRNVLIVREIEALIARHRRVIVFAPSVASARVISAILTIRGVNSEVVTGESDPGDRERAIRRFKGDSDAPIVMCNYGVLTTGFDAPATSAAIIARPTKSLVLYSQMVGRATRGPKAGGNMQAEIVTITDPDLPGFGSVADAFFNWEDVWHE